MDHGSPTIVGTSRPYIIGEQFIPEHQTGLDLFGDHYLGAFKLDYHVTASNGRGTTEPTYDQDSKFAFGGSVKVETPWGLKAGASYYRGRYTGLPAAPGAIAETYREASYGADAQYNHGALHLQSEAMMREHHYVAGQRPANAAGFAPDALDTGLYFLGAWRFDQLWNVTPYTLFESYQTSTSPYFGGLKSLNIGLNFRPSPNLVFKLQGDRTRFDDGPEPLANQKVYSFSAQASWVF
jgi:hypothetical protein